MGGGGDCSYQNKNKQYFMLILFLMSLFSMSVLLKMFFKRDEALLKHWRKNPARSYANFFVATVIM